jgi:hypothetical protein
MAPARAFLAIPKGDKAALAAEMACADRARKAAVRRTAQIRRRLAAKRAIRADFTDLVSTILARYLNGL